MGFLKKNFGSRSKIVSFLLVLNMVLSLVLILVSAEETGTDDSDGQYVVAQDETQEEPTPEISSMKGETQEETTPEISSMKGETQEETTPEISSTEDETQEETTSEISSTEDETQPEETPVTYDFTYDSQPVTLEQVQEAINAYEAEYQAALAADGFLAAIAVPKSHWQYYVAAELMPSGYRCELTDEESAAYDWFGAPYYTFFIGTATTTYVIVDSGTGIIVDTEADFRYALGNAAYTTIYLGADITIETNSNGNSSLVVARTGSLVINGTDPRDGIRHTYMDCSSSMQNRVLGGTCTNITFKDIKINLRNYYGIYYAPNTTSTVTLDNVTGSAREIFYGRGTNSTLVIKDSDLTLSNTGLDVPQEFAQAAGKVRFEGAVTVTRDRAVIYSIFNDITTVEIADGADVVLDNSTATTYYGSVFESVTNFAVGAGAKFDCRSGFGFCVATNPLTTLTIGENADVRFICTDSHSLSSLYGTGSSTFTAGPGSKFLLYDNQSNAAWSACYFSKITLNNVESFVVLNPAKQVIGSTYVPNLTVTGASSIRYYLSDQISRLFDTKTYDYTPTRSPNSWWAQNFLFNVSKTSWSSNASSSTTTTTYATGSKPTASVTVMDTLTYINFAAGSSVYGVEIYGTICTVTYDGNNEDSGTAPASDTGVPNDLMTVQGNTGGLTRGNYTFAGWNTAADGSGTYYNAGATFRIAEDTKFYAVWASDPNLLATVTYYANDGTDAMFSEQALKDADYTMIANSFSNEGYAFTGWNAEEDGSGTSYAEGEMITLPGDITLYAQWEEISAAALVFRKIDAATAEADDVKPLEGTGFELYSCTDDTHTAVSDHIALGETDTCWVLSDIDAEYDASDASIVTFEELEEGFYLLMETTAPDGYQLPKGQWIIKAEGGVISFVGTSGNTYVPAVVARADFNDREDEDNVEFWIGNIERYELPVAGRGGTSRFTLLGCALLGAGVFMIYIYRRRRPETGAQRNNTLFNI